MHTSVFNIKNLLFVIVVLALAGAGFYFLWQKHHEPLLSEKPNAQAEIPVEVAPVVSKSKKVIIGNIK